MNNTQTKCCVFFLMILQVGCMVLLLVSLSSFMIMQSEVTVKTEWSKMVSSISLVVICAGLVGLLYNMVVL